ncbi:solute carrier family 22 member 3 isoform X1 [Bicyclus anynana]|uniref:Solute carrier family 22 member 3 isoform X1 n=1 Tax=Bicyclus anynana TaxID=110368 RepID=A0A6J1N6L1_BICAN|nr:solute carrier family 22 member 3 isoform X1 [Bicyclus anynana]
MEKDVKVSNVSVFKINEIDKEKTDKNVTSESDYLEDCIGANGIWQTFVSFAILTRSIAMFNMISIVFLTPTTDYLCIEFKDNITIEARNGTCYENCTKYVFHSEAMRTTLISEFGLICDREWMASFSQTIIMCGVVFGVSIFGWISDRFGRRVALISSSLLNVITMIPASFVSSYWMFNCLRFVTGIASGGSLIVAIPVIMEITGKRYREYAGATCLLPDGIAQALLALYAYYLPNWDSYLLGLGVTCILILILVCFVPESPRWLVANGKVDNALKIMFGAAKVNKLSTEHITDTVMKSMENMKIEEKKVTASYLDFFKDIQTIIITMSTFVIWFVLGVTYYGIYQYMTFLGSNIYITVVILGLIQVPLCLVEIALTRLFKRRTAIASAFLVTGVSMTGLIFTPEGHWATTLLGVVGFSASSATYAVTYLCQAELFPTPLRNMSFGIVSAAGKVGSMIAPFIANMSPKWVPSLIFSVLSVVAVGFCLLLPETKGKNLKDTID